MIVEAANKVLEMFDGLKIKVYSDGSIETLDHNNVRKNGRVDNRKGKILKQKTEMWRWCHKNVVVVSQKCGR